MDALILSCGTGGGHDSAARAIIEEMNARGHRTVLLNPYKLKSNRLADSINKTYIATVRHTPKVFGAVYKLGDLYRQLPFRSPVYFTNRRMNTALQGYLAENHFDIIITTHIFPAEILTNMKRHGIMVPKTIFVATDYVCIPFMEETECDAYVIPADDLKYDFIDRGLPREKLYPFGIPTHGKFAADESRETVRKRLGLETGKRYILITGGSMGGGKIEKAIMGLRSHIVDKEDVDLIIICGSNKVLFDKLNERPDPKLIVIGHTDDMASYMKASDLFITKPGGLSSTEAAVCGIPILHTSAIPGCESYNARYFSGHGMSISEERTSGMLSAVDKILNDDGISEAMIACQRSCINPCAAARTCELAESMAEQAEEGRTQEGSGRKVFQAPYRS